MAQATATTEETTAWIESEGGNAEKRKSSHAGEPTRKASSILGSLKDMNEGILDRLRRWSHPPNDSKRICEKSGVQNITYLSIAKKRVLDVYSILLGLRWSVLLLLFSTTFYTTWTLFGVVYYVISLAHGDLEPENLPEHQGESGWRPCISNMEGFRSAFLFSIETQYGMGYGGRQTSTECVEAMVTMSLQCVTALLVEAVLAGVVFSKLAMSVKKPQVAEFSKSAVVAQRNGKLQLAFRVCNLIRDSFIVGTNISLRMIRNHVLASGEVRQETVSVKITPDSANEHCIVLIWPITVVHVIDEKSPFYRMSASDLALDNFELHLTLEGTVESTGAPFQARTSYLPSEILWGHQFDPMLSYVDDNNSYQVNFSALNSTHEVHTPRCSAKDLEYRQANGPT